MVESDEEERDHVVGTASAAIIHAGVADGQLWDAMDADSGELEALYGAYFDDDYFKEEYAQGFGHDLLYVSEVSLTPDYQGRNLELAVVRRLCDTLGSGCELVVVAYEGEAEARLWRSMGFTRTPGRDGLMHLSQAFVQPRVVSVRGDEDRFRVQRNESAEAVARRRRLN